MMGLVLSFRGRASHWTSSSVPRKPWSTTLRSLARRPLTGEGNGREKGGGEREREGGGGGTGGRRGGGGTGGRRGEGNGREKGGGGEREGEEGEGKGREKVEDRLHL